MYLGLDLGTSGLKAVVIDDSGRVVITRTAALETQTPQANWVEQDPESWWQATVAVMADLGREIDLTLIQAIGLAGHMHGAVLLDSAGQVLRPCILWNDGRSAEECRLLEASLADFRERSGNIAMPGFTAPKLLWVKRHEPEVFEQTAKVLLPKDYLRYRLTGDYISEMSDAAGTLWLNPAVRDWDDALLEATHLTRDQMPDLIEGSAVSGSVSEASATALGLNTVPVVGGAGDNAAGAIGVGVTEPGQGFISLGTSGVYFVVTTDANHANGQLRYSEVDMSLDGGLGGVVDGVKNIPLGPAGTAFEGLNAIPNHDGSGFWVLSSTAGSPNFLAYEFDANGPVGGPPGTPVITQLDPPNDVAEGYHRIMVSPDLSQILFLTAPLEPGR